MTPKFNEFYNAVFLEISQALVNKTNGLNQLFSGQNQYAKDRAFRFLKKAEDYGLKNNSLIRLKEKSDKVKNFLIEKVNRTDDKTTSNITLYIRGSVYNPNYISGEEPYLHTSELKFRSDGYFYNLYDYDEKQEFTFLDKDDAIRFVKKVKETTGLQIPWKSLKFGTVK